MHCSISTQIAEISHIGVTEAGINKSTYTMGWLHRKSSFGLGWVWVIAFEAFCFFFLLFFPFFIKN